MKTLLLLRHAKSSWNNPDLADHDRPLNSRGKRDAPRIGQLLADEGLTPDLIISSTARRARQTAEAVAEHSSYAEEVRFERDLYHGAPEDYFFVLRDLPDAYETVLLVGHNPGMEELLDLLAGEVERMPTAALARITLPIDRWRDLNDEIEGQLIQIWRPRELAE